uniref:Uncharacterized protein n=1 Tax=Cajanus cajan TaxID=3821 RepID=A0A151TLU9_CAJCA|nr:hypothetical protein KK1_021635 [Cajanus cajan]
MHVFNLAMLGKQAQRPANEPNSLVSGMFKAKYHLHGDFMNAALGHNTSDAWSSLWSTQHLLKARHHWKVDSGANILMWSDP